MSYSSLSLICLGLCFCGCKRRSYNADVHHVANSPTRAEAPWMWVDFEREDYMRDILGIEPGSENARLVLPENHPTTITAQFWVDRIHELLSTRNPQAMANVIKPKVLVLSDKTPNAFVAGGSYCFDIDVSVESLELNQPGQRYVTLDKLAMFRFIDKPAACAQKNPFMGRVPEIAKWLTERMGGKCFVEAKEQGVHFKNCPALLDQFESKQKPKGIALTGSASWIVINSGEFNETTLPEPFARTSSEERFVATVAHELAHYYRTHQMMFPHEYNYWYVRPNPWRPEKPVPTDDKAILADVQRIMEERRPVVNSIPGQKLSPSMFSLLQNIIGSSLRSRFEAAKRSDEFQAILQGIPASCWNAFSLAYSDGRYDYPFILGYPKVLPKNDEEKAIFLEVENVYLQCTQEMKIGGIRNLDPASSARFPYLKIDRVVGLWANQGRKAAEAEVQASGQTMTEVLRNLSRFDISSVNSAIKTYFPNEAQRYEIPAETMGRPLADTLLTVEASLLQASEDYKALVAKVRDARVGYYTVEEEADSMAVEALAGLGLPVEAAIENHYETMLFVEKIIGHDPVLDYSPEECTVMFKNNWAKLPFLGSVSDTHHGNCYRIFNVTEEIQAHKYSLGTRPKLPLDWGQVVQSARDYEKMLDAVK